MINYLGINEEKHVLFAMELFFFVDCIYVGPTGRYSCRSTYM